MSNFTKYENREQKFINWYTDKYNFPIEEMSNDEQYSSNDFVMLSGRTYVMGEVKIRTFESDKYPTAVLEQKKITGLMNKFQEYYKMGENNRILYYAVYPKDRKVLVFDVMNTPSTLTYEYCPKTTAENRGNELKPMVNYKIEDAIEVIEIK